MWRLFSLGIVNCNRYMYCVPIHVFVHVHVHDYKWNIHVHVHDYKWNVHVHVNVYVHVQMRQTCTCLQMKCTCTNKSKRYSTWLIKMTFTMMGENIMVIVTIVLISNEHCCQCVNSLYICM